MGFKVFTVYYYKHICPDFNETTCVLRVTHMCKCQAGTGHTRFEQVSHRLNSRTVKDSLLKSWNMQKKKLSDRMADLSCSNAPQKPNRI